MTNGKNIRITLPICLVFPVDSELNEVKRSWLAYTISSENPEQGRSVEALRYFSIHSIRLP